MKSINVSLLCAAAIAATGSLAASQTNAAVIDLASDYLISPAGLNDTSNSGGGFRVGSSGGGARNVILAFQVPDLGAVANPFLTAALTSRLFQLDTNPDSNSAGAQLDFNADVYGLLSTTASVVDTDPLPVTLFEGAADPDADYVKVIEDYYTPSSSAGVDISASGSLVTLLNSVYDGGAGIGQFFYLRLSPDRVTDAESISYDVLGQEDGNFADSTFITFTAVPEPASLALLGTGLGLLVIRRRAA